MGRKITNLETALDRAFTRLEALGWSTGTPNTLEYSCCTTCASGCFNQLDDKVVFYHIQDRNGYREAKKNKVINPSIMLGHDATTLQIYYELIETLELFGVEVNWDGSHQHKLEVWMA